MDNRSTDIFGPVRENDDDSVEEEEEPEEEQKKNRLVTSSERKEKLRTINQSMIRGVRYVKKWGMTSKNST